jgi:Tol biopolymer transport system component
MNTDGTGKRAITKETFRLLNNAVWTPDSEYLIARKHFTSSRSLGAGEMWMYHIAGAGEGVQLTKRKNDQQDAGEPEISPDGKYVYFSEDVSSGPFFQYNKDPNGEIYNIRRLNRENGEIETVAGGGGGAGGVGVDGVESPLKKAADAIVLDNTHLTRDEQLEFVIQLVNQITIKSFA